MKMLSSSLQVTGRKVDEMLKEVNAIVETEELTLQSVHIASTEPDFRIVFSVNCEYDQQKVFSIRLHESPVFATVTALGTIEHE
jgi:hypothetical protein